MTSYTIQKTPNGFYEVFLGTQLMGQLPDRDQAERFAKTLEWGGHAQRILASTYYDAETNTIKDGETNA